MQIGRFKNVSHNERTCKCKMLQTLKHVIFEFELTKKLHDENSENVAATRIREIEHILKLR